MKKIFTFLTILLLFAGCKKLFEPYDKRTYFKTEGVGYVYHKETKEPVPGAILFVDAAFESRGIATVQIPSERFEADAQGYFRIEFLKRYHKSNVVAYSIFAWDADYKLNSALINLKVENLKVEEIKGQNILNLDTLWIR